MYSLCFTGSETTEAPNCEDTEQGINDAHTNKTPLTFKVELKERFEDNSITPIWWNITKTPKPLSPFSDLDELVDIQNQVEIAHLIKPDNWTRLLSSDSLQEACIKAKIGQPIYETIKLDKPREIYKCKCYINGILMGDRKSTRLNSSY